MNPSAGLRKAAAVEINSPIGSDIRYPGYGKMFLVWSAIAVLTSARYRFFMPPKWGISMLAEVIGCGGCYFPWILLTPLVFRLEQKFPLGTGRWTRNLAILAAISIPFSLVAAIAMMGSFLGVMMVVRDPAWAWHGDFPWVRDVPLAQGIFWSSIAVGYFIRTLTLLRDQERATARLAIEKSQLEAGLNQAQLEVLRARLNPHFLFNSLQNISVMIKQDPHTASRMLTRLGDLLRAVLRQDSQPETTLQQEIDLTRSYVAIEQMRFGDLLIVNFEIPRELNRAMIPCFLLQPLLENAVVHGLRGARKTGIITVAAQKLDGELILTVTDNGIGPPTDDPSELKLGVGLQSTCERLERMYPDHHTFSMSRPAQGGTEIRIAVPFRQTLKQEQPAHDEQPAVADR